MEQKISKGLCLQSETALHTHDSICFKRCRRKWFFSSPFSMHLQPKPAILGVNPHLWFGSGFHWAMEDFYGLRRFNSPVQAFMAYVEAFKPEELPDGYELLVETGIDMLTYFESWMEDHSKWKTVWVNGKPLVEVPFSLVLKEASYYEYKNEYGSIDRFFYVEETMSDDSIMDRWESASTGQWITEEELQKMGAVYQEVVYHGKLDSIVEDERGGWWILDYKTAKAFDTAKLSLDQQISRYCWAAEQSLDHEIEGMLYIQASKSPPRAPKMTQKGVSTDKRQRTTHKLYRQALIDVYGNVQAAPKEAVIFLNDLADKETENGNQFIRYDWVERNDEMKISTYRNIIAEARDMLHPHLRIYPNPTRDCTWDCPFKDMCLAMEEGADWKFYLDEFEIRNETMKSEYPTWEIRMFRKYPELFPEEYAATKEQDCDTVEDFLNKYGEEE